MSFLRDIRDGKKTPATDEDKNMEEQYQKMFKKIARDFMTRKDFEKIFNEYLELSLSDVASQIDITQREEAYELLNTYKENLEKRLKDRREFRDLGDDWIF